MSTAPYESAQMLKISITESKLDMSNNVWADFRFFLFLMKHVAYLVSLKKNDNIVHSESEIETDKMIF